MESKSVNISELIENRNNINSNRPNGVDIDPQSFDRSIS